MPEAQPHISEANSLQHDASSPGLNPDRGGLVCVSMQTDFGPAYSSGFRNDMFSNDCTRAMLMSFTAALKS